MKKTLVSIVLVVLIVGAGATVATVLVRTAPEPPLRDVARRLPLVQVVAVNRQTVREQVVAYGTARAMRAADITSEVTGAVIEVADGLEDGAAVSLGDLLLRVDASRYEQVYNQRKALAESTAAQVAQLDVRKENLEHLLEIAQREVDVTLREERRLATLREIEAGTEREHDAALLVFERSVRQRTEIQNELNMLDSERARLEALQRSQIAEAKLAEVDVERCSVAAPFDGYVESLNVEAGEVISPGMVLMRIVDRARIEVPIAVPVSYRSWVEPGAPATLWMDSAEKQRWSGVVERVAPSADEQSRTFEAYIAAENRERQSPILPGMFVTAEVVGPPIAAVLRVPRGAIVDDHVFVMEETLARMRAVEVDGYMGEHAVLSGGEVSDGDYVIVTNLDVLEDGMEVVVDAGTMAPGDVETSNAIDTAILSDAADADPEESP